MKKEKNSPKSKPEPEMASSPEVKKPVAVYDPAKNYKWEPTDTFSLSGQEFGIILNGLRAVLSTEQARSVLFADRANQAIEQVLRRSVSSGIAKEEPSK